VPSPGGAMWPKMRIAAEKRYFTNR
jgi:hypothetical protein